MPHPPFFFKKDGSPRSKEEVLYDERNRLYPIDKYLDNVHYTNQKIETFVSFIQKKEKKNAVIMIVGDHGFRQNNPPREAYFSNFNAVYFPPAFDTVSFPETISLVNQFRFIFNQCTNTSLPFIQDRAYFLTDAESE
jgi:phosphoglycerol transferase MdoB-like AlkP superfamily enzyme